MPPPIRPRAPNFSVTEVTLTAASPERHQRVIAKPDEVVTSFRLSGIIGGVMLHDPIAMVCTATNTVRLYVSITVNRRSLLEDRRGVNKWFTPNLNRHISHPAAPYISPRYVGVVGAHRQHQPSSWTGCKNTRGHFWPKSPMCVLFERAHSLEPAHIHSTALACCAQCTSCEALVCARSVSVRLGGLRRHGDHQSDLMAAVLALGPGTRN